MAKQSGVGSRLWVGAVDLTGDTGAINSLACPVGVFDVTDISEAAMERIRGRRDGALAFTSYWNTAAGQAHLTLSALPRTDVQVTCAAGTPAVGTAAASLIAKQLDYAPSMGADGSLVAAVNAAANGYPLEWGELLTAGAQVITTGTVNGTSIDLGSASTAFGAAAYLTVLSVTSGTATFTIEDSANDTDFLPVTGMAFAGATAATTERVQGAVNATVRRYVRFSKAGAQGACTAVVNFVRYTSSPA